MAKRANESGREPKDARVIALGHEIEAAAAAKDLKLIEAALQTGGAINASDLEPNDRVFLHYFLSIGYDDVRIARTRGKPDEWKWKQPEFEEALFHLRSAMRDSGFEAADASLKLQIWTNAGNLLDTLGRPLEAIEIYDRAINFCRDQNIPAFAMAVANKAFALQYLAGAHYDHGQSAILLYHAYHLYLDSVTRNWQLGPGVAPQISEKIIWLEQNLDSKFLFSDLKWGQHSLGRSKAERAYRKWCLENRLFLNTLNEVAQAGAVAHDCLSMPSHAIEQGGPPTFVNLFNGIKQEFVSARFVLWEGIHSDRSHFSDRHTSVVNTFEDLALSLAVEKIRMAFRAAYSLLDKVAFVVNIYFGLEIDSTKINLNRIWFHKGNPRGEAPKGGFNAELLARENWPLRGLFWLARDLFDDAEQFRNLVDPDALRLKRVRNLIEHQFLGVYYRDGISVGPLREEANPRISRSELAAKAIRLMQLARSALIYAVLAIHREESVRKSERPSNQILLPVVLPTVADNTKV